MENIYASECNTGIYDNYPTTNEWIITAISATVITALFGLAVGLITKFIEKHKDN